MVAKTSESLVEYGREEQEQESKTKVIVDLEQEIDKYQNYIRRILWNSTKRELCLETCRSEPQPNKNQSATKISQKKASCW